jgi:acetylornithine deacetylase/succinyl-diaminopimelate desuccinylase-like protein
MQERLMKKLTEKVPYDCKVTVGTGHAGQGWCMKAPEGWVKDAFESAGPDFFSGNKTSTYGLGFSIPFLAELGKHYPDAGIYALGVLGPRNNAHAPNENLNLDYTKRLTCALSHLIASVGAN